MEKKERKLGYPNFVNREGIEIDACSSEGVSFRFSLTVPFTCGGTETALVVMMNPSKATRHESDQTVNNVLTRVHRERPDVSRVVIANLYPLYETNSSLLENHQTQSQINTDIIKALMVAADFVLLGWGKPSDMYQPELAEIKYHEHSLQAVRTAIESGIPAYGVGELVENLYPRHQGRLPRRDLMSKLDLKDLEAKIQDRIDRNAERFKESPSK